MATRDKEEEREGYLLVLPTFPFFLLKYFLRQRAIRETDLDKLAITARHAPASASSTAEWVPSLKLLLIEETVETMKKPSVVCERS